MLKTGIKKQNRMRFSSLFLMGFAFFFVSSVQAKILIVTDVDDTIKRSHILDTKNMVRHALDYKGRFFGMASLLTLLVEETGGQLAYISNAPEVLMKDQHKRLLKFGGFPNGYYRGRHIGDSKDTHKLNQISNLIETIKPTQVILIGDNGEADSNVYWRLAGKYHASGIRFHTFIRVLYGKKDGEVGVAPPSSHLGFITPFEVVLNLEDKGLVSAEAVEHYIENEGLRYLNSDLQESEVRYTYFQRCELYRFPLRKYFQRFAYIEAINTDIERFCRN